MAALSLYVVAALITVLGNRVGPLAIAVALYGIYRQRLNRRLSASSSDNGGIGPVPAHHPTRHANTIPTSARKVRYC